ncbi:MAG TPA: hypothetical protein VKR56_14110 [Candidatus Cybelea sp.]|nr:hypothetical protein [Candidatus Cybelea sp.]
MRMRFAIARSWLGALALVSMVAACGRPSQLGLPASATPAVRGSWMLPDASKADLMYVADAYDDRVDVYAYPNGRRVGELTGFAGLAFMCVDGGGDVFIPDYGASQILEYAHGGTKPMETLSDGKAEPYSCSVDPTTGNLAVANFGVEGDKFGDVVIYRDAKGKPKAFSVDEEMAHAYFCAYDDSGNLFAEGSSPAASGGSFGFAEKSKGASQFAPVTLEDVPVLPSGLQWDGTYLAIGTGTIAGPSSGNTYVYHVEVAHFVGKTIATTQLVEKAPTADFFIDGSTIVASGGDAQSTIGFFHYPKGGAPVKTLTETSPFGVVVSPAAK